MRSPTLRQIAHRIRLKPYQNRDGCLHSRINQNFKALVFSWLVENRIPNEGYWRVFFEESAEIAITNQVHGFLIRLAIDQQFPTTDIYL